MRKEKYHTRIKWALKERMAKDAIAAHDLQFLDVFHLVVCYFSPRQNQANEY